MKSNLTIKTLLVAGLVFLCATFTKAGDVNLRIPVTSIYNLFETVINSKWFNYGAAGNGITTYYSVKMNAVTISVQPNNQFTFNFGLKAYANFNLGLFSFDKTSNGTLSGSGTLVLVPVGDGYKIKFDMQNINYSANDWYADLLNFSLQLFKSKIPEISTSSQQPLFPTNVTTFFTSATPSLSTTATEIILSYDLAVGPRYITAFNEVDEDRNIGNIENTTEGEENIHTSPYTFEWYSGSQKSIRTPQEILEPLPQSYFKYQNWFNNSLPLPQISPREIEINVGNSDQSYKAFFKDAVRIQGANLLEWTQSGGQVLYNGQGATTQNKYEFTNASANIQLGSTPPINGIDWVFKGWSDGNMSQTRTVNLSNNLDVTAIYKAKSHSTVSNVVGLDNRRLIVEEPIQGYVYRVYESANRLWVQFRPKSDPTWTNEFEVPLPFEDDNGDGVTNSADDNGYDEISMNGYSQVRNPRIATSLGTIWLVYEAYDISFAEWKYMATCIIDPVNSVRKFVHKTLNNVADTDFVQNTVNVSIAGENGPSYNGTAIAIAYQQPGSELFHLLSLTQGGTRWSSYHGGLIPKPITQLSSTGTNPTSSSASYSLSDIAVHYGKIGLVASSNNQIRYFEAYVTQSTSLIWQPQHSLSIGSPFSNQNYAPSIVNWGNYFKMVWTATVSDDLDYEIVAWRNVGSGATNTAVNYIFNDELDFYMGNYFEGVQASKVNVTTYATYNAATLAFSVKFNQPGYGTSRIMSYQVTDQGATNIIYTQNMNNRSVSPFSSTSKTHAIYITSNQGLYKLNEIQAPTGTAKAVELEEKKGFVSAVVHYQKGKKEHQQVWITDFSNGSSPLPLAVEVDSTGTMWLTDWFTAKDEISVSTYTSDKGQVPFSLIAVNENGNTIASKRLKATSTKNLFKQKKNQLTSSFNKETVFNSLSSEKVRIKVVPSHSSAQVVLTQAVVPVKQENELTKTSKEDEESALSNLDIKENELVAYQIHLIQQRQ